MEKLWILLWLKEVDIRGQKAQLYKFLFSPAKNSSKFFSFGFLGFNFKFNSKLISGLKLASSE